MLLMGKWFTCGILANGMERHIIENELVGKRARGRQRMMVCDWMTTRLNVCNVKDLGNIARDREKWRKCKS